MAANHREASPGHRRPLRSCVRHADGRAGRAGGHCRGTLAPPLPNPRWVRWDHTGPELWPANPVLDDQDQGRVPTRSPSWELCSPVLRPTRAPIDGSAAFLAAYEDARGGVGSPSGSGRSPGRRVCGRRPTMPAGKHYTGQHDLPRRRWRTGRRTTTPPRERPGRRSSRTWTYRIRSGARAFTGGPERPSGAIADLLHGPGVAVGVLEIAEPYVVQRVAARDGVLAKDLDVADLDTATRQLGLGRADVGHDQL